MFSRTKALSGLPIGKDPDKHIAALQTSVPAFRFNLRPILLLGVGLVVFTALAVGFVVHLILPMAPFAICVALGAVVAPPWGGVTASAELAELWPVRFSATAPVKALVMLAIRMWSVASGARACDRSALPARNTVRWPSR